MRPRHRLTLRLGLLAAALLATACQRAATGPAPTGVAPAPAVAAAARMLPFAPPKWKAFPRRSLLQAEPPRWPLSTFAGPTSADLQCSTDPTFCVLPQGLDDGRGREARFRMISGMVTDASGNAYLVDANAFQVKKVAPDGTVTTLAGGYGGTGGLPVDGPGHDARFALPWDIALGPAGDLYVTDRNANLVRKVAPSGEVSTVPTSALINPEHVAVDGAGNVYVTSGTREIRKYAPDGTELQAISFRNDLPPQDGPLYSPGVLNGPLSAMALDAEGNLYLASENQGSIRKVSPDLVVTTLAGATEQGYLDGPAAEARFSRISDLVADGAGGLYVADAHNNVIRHLSAAGMVSTVAGSGEYGYDDGPGDSADLAAWSQVLSIAIDKCGNLLIAEPERIRQAVTPNPSQPQAACIPPADSALSLQHAAFSPDRPNSNPDDNKDTVEIRVGAEPGESWKLELMGKGELQSGVGPTTIVWNGHRPRNPAAILPDGMYSFLLERPNKPERTATVIIDTRKPKIDEAKISKIGAERGVRGFQFTFNVSAVDGTADMPGSGLEAPSPDDVLTDNVTSVAVGLPTVGPEGSAAYMRTLEPRAVPALEYHAVIRDIAGNTATKNFRWSDRLSVAGAVGVPSEDCDAPSPYRLQGIEDGEATARLVVEMANNCTEAYSVDGLNSPFFSVGTSKPFKYYLGFQQTEGVTQPYLTAPASLRFIKKDDAPPPLNLQYSKGVLWANFELALSTGWFGGFHLNEITWDGRRNFFNAEGQPGPFAPSGKYDVEVIWGYPDFDQMEDDDFHGIPGMLFNEEVGNPGRRVKKLKPFSVINHGDAIAWGPDRPGTETEIGDAFDAAKTYLAPAGRRRNPGTSDTTTHWEWHHVVEKRQTQFPVRLLNSTYNLVRVPFTKHKRITSFYARRNGIPNSNNRRVWEVLRDTMNFQEQYIFGLQQLQAEGWNFTTESDPRDIVP